MNCVLCGRPLPTLPWWNLWGRLWAFRMCDVSDQSSVARCWRRYCQLVGLPLDTPMPDVSH